VALEGQSPTLRAAQSPINLRTEAEDNKIYLSSGRHWASLCVIATAKRSHYHRGELIIMELIFSEV
jgi:hypothetical protein